MSSSNDSRSLLREIFGFESFRGHQQEVIAHVHGGGDALVVMPTGSGKSLCYQLPAIQRPGTGIVVSPLIALMEDQVMALGQLGVRAAALNSSLAPAAAREVRQRLLRGALDLLYVAPERLLGEGFLELLGGVEVNLFAIDEAHCVSQWGHDFRPEYLELAILAERFPGVPRLALTATADPPTRREIVDRLRLTAARLFVAGFDRPNLLYRVRPKDNPRRQLLELLRGQGAEDSGIVYCLSRRRTEELAGWLREQGFEAVAYHAGLDAAERRQSQRAFSADRVRIVVATVAFGMGIDKPDVRFVVHFDPPKSFEAYYQETGRAGRDGLPAEVLMLYGLQDVALLRHLISSGEAGEERKRIEHLKLNALLGYCETARCRRRVLLEYFGEARAEPCGNCDNCLEPVAVRDGTVDAQKALSAVARTGQRFGQGHVLDVLTGQATDKILRLGHDRLPTFGAGADLHRRDWQSAIRQLVALGLLSVDVEGYGALRLTAEAKAVLRGEQRVELRQERRVAKAARKSRRAAAAAELGDGEAGLFEQLRALRLELARAEGIPPYMVFSDRTLLEMARLRPANLRDLSRIHGVGAVKLERYGATFLARLAEAS